MFKMMVSLSYLGKENREITLPYIPRVGEILVIPRLHPTKPTPIRALVECVTTNLLNDNTYWYTELSCKNLSD